LFLENKLDASSGILENNEMARISFWLLIFQAVWIVVSLMMPARGVPYFLQPVFASLGIIANIAGIITGARVNSKKIMMWVHIILFPVTGLMALAFLHY